MEVIVFISFSDKIIWLESKINKGSEFMRIGIFTDTYPPYINGVSTSVLMLKQGLEKFGHKVYVVTVNSESFSYKKVRPVKNFIKSILCYLTCLWQILICH